MFIFDIIYILTFMFFGDNIICKYFILVNIVTNPLVVSIPVVVLVKYNYKSSIIMLLILEILTVLFEGLIYLKTLSYKKIN